MERDRWQPFEGEVTPSQRLGIRQRLADLAFRFIETIVPADLNDVEDDDTDL